MPAHPPAPAITIAQMCSYDPHHRTGVRRSCKQPNGWFGSASDGACLDKLSLYTSDKSPQKPARTHPKNPPRPRPTRTRKVNATTRVS